VLWLRNSEYCLVHLPESHKLAATVRRPIMPKRASFTKIAQTASCHHLVQRLAPRAQTDDV